ncbi:rds2-regulator of drug sensitivity, partial [Rhizoctonia solani]
MTEDDRPTDPSDQSGIEGGKKSAATTTKGQKRRKVNHACLYCRRSHMTCDEGRPCQRCSAASIKRDIGHLCHDEKKPGPSKNNSSTSTPQPQPTVDITATPSVIDSSANPTPIQPPEGFPMAGAPQPFAPVLPQSTPQWPLFSNPPFGLTGDTTTLGNEFSVLSDFLQSLDSRGFQPFAPGSIVQDSPQAPSQTPGPQPTMGIDPDQSQPSPEYPGQIQMPSPAPAPHTELTEPLLPSATKQEKFLLTAADQEPGTRDERLARVIHAKYEAGLLRPYNYVKGYARLSRWMDHNVSQESKKQILQPLSVLRPKFRAIAQSLTDIVSFLRFLVQRIINCWTPILTRDDLQDLVFIEEAFERLLLDYDRVFSAMGIPACLWRRTGEIYKGNREFAELVGVDVGRLRDGKMCIYELMSEESAVNYWEKYGHVAFDPAQKAVLTSCVLRYKPTSNSGLAPSNGSNGSTHSSPVLHRQVTGAESTSTSQSGFINCCFSFTIRRDTWGIPSVIVADFFYHIVGDKTSYSQELENLFVCYTLTRGLRQESPCRRRPSLPLEIILSIIRYAGFMSVNPDPALALETQIVPCKHPHLFCGGYSTPPLSRIHLNFMARLRLSYEPGVLSSEFPSGYEHNIAWDQHTSEGHLVLRPCISPTSRSPIYSLPRAPNHFTPDNEIFDHTDKMIRVVSSRPARLLVWRWWEPKF